MAGGGGGSKVPLMEPMGRGALDLTPPSPILCGVGLEAGGVGLEGREAGCFWGPPPLLRLSGERVGTLLMGSVWASATASAAESARAKPSTANSLRAVVEVRGVVCIVRLSPRAVRVSV